MWSLLIYTWSKSSREVNANSGSYKNTLFTFSSILPRIYFRSLHEEKCNAIITYIYLMSSEHFLFIRLLAISISAFLEFLRCLCQVFYFSVCILIKRKLTKLTTFHVCLQFFCHILFHFIHGIFLLCRHFKVWFSQMYLSSSCFHPCGLMLRSYIPELSIGHYFTSKKTLHILFYAKRIYLDLFSVQVHEVTWYEKDN